MYTLLQFLSLLIFYLFILGFERESQWGNIQGSLKEKPFSLLKFKRFFLRHRLSPFWLVLCLFLIWLNAFQVHLLGVFILGGLFVYLFFKACILAVTEIVQGSFLNKYSVLTVCAVVIATAGWFLVPSIRDQSHHFLSYTPPWAEAGSSAHNRMVLFEYLLSPYRFPFAAFFFIGGVQLISRRERLGWIPAFGFLFPLFCLTFVFTHRVPTYLFYVYPLFLMIAAFGFVNLLESERLVMLKDAYFRKRFIRTGVFVLYFLVFLISPWLRISFHIPFFEDGKTNLAVTPNEWREAGQYVEGNFKDGDVTISSLPILAMYYGIHSDYDLNWTHLSQAKAEAFQNPEGRWADVYAGVTCIESVEELDEIVQSRGAGWIAVAKYHMEHTLIIPQEIRNYLEMHFDEPFRTKNETVWVYHWEKPAGESD
jgi:hypothetical protein